MKPVSSNAIQRLSSLRDQIEVISLSHIKIPWWKSIFKNENTCKLDLAKKKIEEYKDIPVINSVITTALKVDNVADLLKIIENQINEQTKKEYEKIDKEIDEIEDNLTEEDIQQLSYFIYPRVISKKEREEMKVPKEMEERGDNKKEIAIKPHLITLSTEISELLKKYEKDPFIRATIERDLLNKLEILGQKIEINIETDELLTNIYDSEKTPEKKTKLEERIGFIEKYAKFEKLSYKDKSKLSSLTFNARTNLTLIQEGKKIINEMQERLDKLVKEEDFVNKLEVLEPPPPKHAENKIIKWIKCRIENYNQCIKKLNEIAIILRSTSDSAKQQSVKEQYEKLDKCLSDLSQISYSQAEPLHEKFQALREKFEALRNKMKELVQKKFDEIVRIDNENKLKILQEIETVKEGNNLKDLKSLRGKLSEISALDISSKSQAEVRQQLNSYIAATEKTLVEEYNQRISATSELPALESLKSEIELLDLEADKSTSLIENLTKKISSEELRQKQEQERLAAEQKITAEAKQKASEVTSLASSTATQPEESQKKVEEVLKKIEGVIAFPGKETVEEFVQKLNDMASPHNQDKQIQEKIGQIVNIKKEKVIAYVEGTLTALDKASSKEKEETFGILSGRVINYKNQGWLTSPEAEKLWWKIKSSQLNYRSKQNIETTELLKELNRIKEELLKNGFFGKLYDFLELKALLIKKAYLSKPDELAKHQAIWFNEIQDAIEANQLTRDTSLGLRQQFNMSYQNLEIIKESLLSQRGNVNGLESEKRKLLNSFQSTLEREYIAILYERVSKENQQQIQKAKEEAAAQAAIAASNASKIPSRNKKKRSKDIQL